MNYSFSEDRGKRLENVVFRHLLAQTEDIFFARNGWECDFAVFPSGHSAQLIQVTERLDSDNIGRELKGLIAGRQFIGEVEGLLLVDTTESGLDIPQWIRVLSVQQWLLEQMK